MKLGRKTCHAFFFWGKENRTPTVYHAHNENGNGDKSNSRVLHWSFARIRLAETAATNRFFNVCCVPAARPLPPSCPRDRLPNEQRNSLTLSALWRSGARPFYDKFVSHNVSHNDTIRRRDGSKKSHNRGSATDVVSSRRAYVPPRCRANTAGPSRRSVWPMPLRTLGGGASKTTTRKTKSDCEKNGRRLIRYTLCVHVPYARVDNIRVGTSSYTRRRPYGGLSCR